MSKKLLFLGVVMVFALFLPPSEGNTADCVDCCLIVGDANNDGIISYHDYYFIINYGSLNQPLNPYLTYPAPECEEQANPDKDGIASFYTDALIVGSFIYSNHDIDTIAECEL